MRLLVMHSPVIRLLTLPPLVIVILVIRLLVMHLPEMRLLAIVFY